MQIVKPETNIDFVGRNRLAICVSLIIILAGLFSLVAKGGFKYGIDFAGGTLIQVQFSQKTEAAEIRQALQGLPLGSFTVQQIGNDANEFLIRAQQTDGELQPMAQAVDLALQSAFGKGKVELRRTEMVGSQVGRDLKKNGLLALVYAIGGTLLYISWRFEFRFAVGAVVALMHDVLITLGFFSLFNRELDLTSIAAFLTIIGYSLNDTIVVFDRIREVKGKSPDLTGEMINTSINQTLSRTLLTSLTTLIVVVILYTFGGQGIRAFAFSLVIGVVVGTYSSIFVASPVLYWMSRPAAKTVTAVKDAGTVRGATQR